MNSATPDKLPRWNTTNIYSGLEADDYRWAVQKLEADLAALEHKFDARQIRRLPAPPQQDDETLGTLLVETVRLWNDLACLAATLDSFVYAFLSTDSYDAVAARETSRLEIIGTRRQQLGVRLQGWLGSIGPRLEVLIKQRPTLASHRFFLTDSARRSRFLMDEELEKLAAELCLDSGVAFGKLQGNVTSQLKVPFERGGVTESLPITVVHNYCFDPDPAVRERAYHAEIAGWHSAAHAGGGQLERRQRHRDHAGPPSRPRKRFGRGPR